MSCTEMQPVKVYLEDHFSIDRDPTTGKYYLAIPVSNGLVEYDEWYLIPDAWALDPDQHETEIKAEVARARKREIDDKLLLKPGRLRGSPT